VSYFLPLNSIISLLNNAMPSSFVSVWEKQQRKLLKCFNSDIQGFLYLMFFMFSMAQRVYPKPWKLRITRWFWCFTFLHSEGIKTVPHSPYRLISVPSSEKRNFEIEIGAVKALEATLKTPSKNGFQHVFQQWQYPWWDKVLGGSIQRVS
jgi:hypothetical protein